MIECSRNESMACMLVICLETRQAWGCIARLLGSGLMVRVLHFLVSRLVTKKALRYVGVFFF